MSKRLFCAWPTKRNVGRELPVTLSTGLVKYGTVIWNELTKAIEIRYSESKRIAIYGNDTLRDIDVYVYHS
jgi:hypothetical protein